MANHTLLRRSSNVRNGRQRTTERKYLSKRNWEWLELPEGSAHANFFLTTSIHGLQYLGQRKRHLCERVFWLIAFIAALITATILIWQMWDGYVSMPIVTVFNPTEKTLEQIPFPAVTVCSVNNVKQSKWEEYNRDVVRGLRGNGEVSNDTMLRRMANMADIFHICYSSKSFAQRFFKPILVSDDYVRENMISRRDHWIPLLDAIGTLRSSSQSCREMIIFCLWLDSVKNCSELFQQIETDYGYCCTFNMMPVTLLRAFVKDPTDDPRRVKDWEEADLDLENLLLEKGQTRKYPYRQLYAGRSAGLSFLLDPNLEEYHCTNTDSEGFVVGLNIPLDFPRMTDHGIAIRTSTENFISVRPEITLSAMSARKAEKEKRHCYFRGEKKLSHYKIYTPSNCLDECMAKKTFEVCGCIRYYMPQSGDASTNGTLCSPSQYDCTEHVKEDMIKSGLDKECDNCWPGCSDIAYHTQVTSLRTKESQIKELLKNHPNITLSDERARHATIIHVYFSVDSVFPRLRKEMSTIIELISNAGGLLGLCMGFSMLSMLEIFYHATIRLLCNVYRDREQHKETVHENYTSTSTINPNQMYGSTGTLGTLSKLFTITRGPSIRDFNDSHIKLIQSIPKSNDVRNDQNLSPTHAYLRSPLETDYQRAYLATTYNFVRFKDYNFNLAKAKGPQELQ